MAAGLAIPHGRTKDPGLAGRDAEVAEIGAFLTATAGAPSALVIVGDVGIGKTAVWALVRAHQGDVDEARGLAAEALALAEKSGNIPLMSSVLAVLGFIATSLGDYPAAHAHLDRLARLVAGAGLDQPSVVKFLPDEIEALAALGEIGLAEALLHRQPRCPHHPVFHDLVILFVVCMYRLTRSWK